MTVQNLATVNHDEALHFTAADPWLQMRFKLRGSRYPVYLFPDFDDLDKKINMKVFSFRLYCAFSDGNVMLRLNVIWFNQDIEADKYVWHPLRPYQNACKLRDIMQRKYSLKELVKLNEDNKNTVDWVAAAEDYTMNQILSNE